MKVNICYLTSQQEDTEFALIRTGRYIKKSEKGTDNWNVKI